MDTRRDGTNCLPGCRLRLMGRTHHAPNVACLCVIQGPIWMNTDMNSWRGGGGAPLLCASYNANRMLWPLGYSCVRRCKACRCRAGAGAGTTRILFLLLPFIIVISLSKNLSLPRVITAENTR